MSVAVVEQVLPGVHLGEGPHWVHHHQCLLFVDIVKGDVHRYFLQTKRCQVLHIEGGEAGGTVSLVVPVEGAPDLFMVSLGRSLAVVEWSVSDPDYHTVRPKAILHTVDHRFPTNRFNDGKCDPRGRLWAGTMGHEDVPGQPELYRGSLFCLDGDLRLTDRVNKVSIANGLAWSLERKTFYYIDSCAYSVDAFDYDESTSQIENRRTVVDYKTSGLGKDIPDGMCIDEVGNLWVANFYGKKVICIDPEIGKIVRSVELPARDVTSVCWGGPHYSTLFVTSAQTGLSAEELASQPAAGGVFAISGLGVKGLPPTNFSANLDLLKKQMSSEVSD
ncbi:regucalcin [Procambarus clarkii]|uniref:regucalcin n=1 Tax=Procambarus clarkii TaxID=6728 RepID=UPI0037446A5F